MIYGIASYKRPSCRTIETLLNAGVKPSEIVVSVQTEDDYRLYSEKHKGIRIVFRNAANAAGNRNTLLECISERPICLMDDDVVSISIMGKSGNGFRVNTEKALAELEHECAIASSEGYSMLGIAPLSNAIIGRARPDKQADVLLCGGVLYVLDKSLRFDERFSMVEDYELVLRVVYNGGHVIRLNRYAMNKPKNGTNEGGMHERYQRGELPFWLTRLRKKYPIFKPNSQMTGGRIEWR